MEIILCSMWSFSKGTHCCQNNPGTMTKTTLKICCTLNTIWLSMLLTFESFISKLIVRIIKTTEKTPSSDEYCEIQMKVREAK